MEHARNVLIILLIALGVVAIPGGYDAAGLTSAVLSLLFVSLIAYFVGRLYRDRQVDIYGLGDVDRAVLYVALGGIVVILAASSRLFNSGAGTLVGIALLAVCAAVSSASTETGSGTDLTSLAADLTSERRSLPDQPGVYLFRDGAR